MKNNYQFQWFAPEDGRRQLRASISRDGMLRLGQVLRSELPANIHVGFDVKRRALAIKDGQGQGKSWNKGGIVAARNLSRQITALGIELPVAFQIAWEDDMECFVGHILPQRKKAVGRCFAEYDWEQIAIIYQPFLEAAACQLAKSTPLAERKSLAREALVSALQRYRPGYGELEDYIDTQIRSTLIQENKFYTVGFRERSLDQPIAASEGNAFCLYDTLEASTDGGIGAAEERVMAEQFFSQLSPKEKQFAIMLRDGTRLPQIAAHLQVAEKDLTKMASEIAKKRKSFYGED